VGSEAQKRAKISSRGRLCDSSAFLFFWLTLCCYCIYNLNFRFVVFVQSVI